MSTSSRSYRPRTVNPKSLAPWVFRTWIPEPLILEGSAIGTNASDSRSTLVMEPVHTVTKRALPTQKGEPELRQTSPWLAPVPLEPLGETPLECQSNAKPRREFDSEGGQASHDRRV